MPRDGRGIAHLLELSVKGWMSFRCTQAIALIGIVPNYACG